MVEVDVFIESELDFQQDSFYVSPMFVSLLTSSWPLRWCLFTYSFFLLKLPNSTKILIFLFRILVDIIERQKKTQNMEKKKGVPHN